VSIFYNLGRQLGRKAAPAIRKSKWVWDGLAGDEEAALRAEVNLGASMAAEFRAASDLVADPEQVGELAHLARRVSANLRDKRRTFECVVFRHPAPNAVALPGGVLFFSDSLLNFCSRQRDELAFVVAHEIAHVALKHSWDRMLNESVLRVAAAATSRLGGAVGSWLRQRGVEFLRSAHDRDCEFSADELGLRLAAAGGFAPEGALLLLQRVQHASTEPASLGQYFATHPPPGERLSRLRSLVQQLSEPLPGKLTDQH
jgi:predicted Zn-dependent protease